MTNIEKPCLNLELIPFREAITTIPAVPAQKAGTTCHCTNPKECPKGEIKITMHCFRNRRYVPKPGKDHGL